jgi:hypothetical protein
MLYSPAGIAFAAGSNGTCVVGRVVRWRPLARSARPRFPPNRGYRAMATAFLIAVRLDVAPPWVVLTNPLTPRR